LTPVILSRFSVETGSFANLHSISAAKSENPQNFDKIEKLCKLTKIPFSTENLDDCLLPNIHWTIKFRGASAENPDDEGKPSVSHTTVVVAHVDTT